MSKSYRLIKALGEGDIQVEGDSDTSELFHALMQICVKKRSRQTVPLHSPSHRLTLVVEQTGDSMVMSIYKAAMRAKTAPKTPVMEPTTVAAPPVKGTVPLPATPEPDGRAAEEVALLVVGTG